MNKLKSLLLYGGLDREVYKTIRPRVSEDNKKSVAVFTLISAACFLFAAVMTIKSKADVPLSIYFVTVGVFVAMYVINAVFSRSAPKTSDYLAILYSIIMLAAGVFLAYSQSAERTTLLLPLFALVSLVFCYRPIYLFVIIYSVEIIYLIIMHSIQSESLFFVNFVNTLIFSSVGVICGIYTMQIKFKKYKAEWDRQRLLERDTLKGLYNRYCWKKELDRIAEAKESVTVCSLDINGLKQVNDSMGHRAGDELIQGAARCIYEVFSTYGKVYRTGGDEFSVLMSKPYDEEALRRQFKEKTAAWRGELSDRLSVALGMFTLDCGDGSQLEAAFHEADLQMLDDKREYYSKAI